MMYEPEIEPAHTHKLTHTHTLHVFVSRIMRGNYVPWLCACCKLHNDTRRHLNVCWLCACMCLYQGICDSWAVLGGGVMMVHGGV